MQLSQDDYLRLLRNGVAKYGLSGFAKQLGISRQRLYKEIHTERTYARYEENAILEALGLRRIQSLHYESMGGPFDHLIPQESAHAQ